MWNNDTISNEENGGFGFGFNMGMMGMNMLYLSFFWGLYVGIDKYIGTKYKGKYYLIHGINNALIVYLTYNDTLNTFFDFKNVLTTNVSILPSIITLSLHLYHVYVYRAFFTQDDWTHHILMGAALIFAHQFETGRLINYSLFFTTGFPGSIDYFLLFLVKNDKLDSIYEKKINSYINLWIRAPGCISHSVITLIVYYTYKYSTSGYIEHIGFISTAAITYWNGIYFMNKVVISYHNCRLSLNEKIEK